MTPVAAIGLDGVAWHLLDPMLDAGVMPRLASLREHGATGTLASTVPTYTPPAWTSAITGVNPGRHGIYGFVESNAQSGRQELVHSGKVKAPTVWEIVNAQEARVGIYNVPLTYPPRDVDGWMVSGMLTPGYGERRTGFVTPRELETAVLEWAPDYVLDISANWERDWRDTVLCERVIASLDQRFRVLQRLLESHPVDVVFAVFEAPDRLQHVYYGYLDPGSPLYLTPEARRIRPAIERCFGALDRLVGLLEDYADGGVIVCSDHGFTAWEASVHTNTLLEAWGLLRFKPLARAMRSSLARSIVPVAKRVLPAKVAREAKGRTFAAIDWSRTKAFASPIPQQGIFVNLRGREPRGIVAADELEPLKDEIVERFASLRGPDGHAVTDRVWRSEEVFHGAALRGAPDVLPVLRDHRYELDDEVFHRRPFSDFRHLPRGVHHPDGVVVVAGSGVEAGAAIGGSVMDVMPMLLYLAGLALPEDLDGSVIEDAFVEEHLKEHPLTTIASPTRPRGEEESPYSAEEEAEIEEALRGLGYL